MYLTILNTFGTLFVLAFEMMSQHLAMKKKEKITPINQYNSVKMMCVSVGRVTVRFNDSAVRVGYSAGWLFTNTDDTEYTITLGPEEDGSESFLGGMANLIIDDR